MGWKEQINDTGKPVNYRNTETGECLSPKEFERRMQMGQLQMAPTQPAMTAMPPSAGGGYGGFPAAGGTGVIGGYTGAGAGTMGSGAVYGQSPSTSGLQSQLMQAQMGAAQQAMGSQMGAAQTAMSQLAQMGRQSQIQPSMMQPGMTQPGMTQPGMAPSPYAAPPQGENPLIQPGARMLSGLGSPDMINQSAPATQPAGMGSSNFNSPSSAMVPTAGDPMQEKNLRLEGVPGHGSSTSGLSPYKNHGFLDATSIAVLLPTLVLLALILAAAHKKRLFPWQTLRTFNPPSGLMNPRDYERSYLCPPNLRRHGRLGKRNPNATWSDADGVVIPFGFLARTHLPITIPIGRLPNKNMFIVAPSGSGKTTLMRAVIKALLAKPCVIIALEAKANDPNLDEKREGFKYTILPEAQHAGFDTLYFNPLDQQSIHWNPLELDSISFASSIVQDINSLDAEEQHWAERDHGYIFGLTQLLKWGAVQVVSEDENGNVETSPLPCNPRGLMKLVNNRRNIVESLRRLKNNPEVDATELSEMTQTLSSIIRTDSDWDKNIQGVRGRLRMFKNPNVLRVTEQSNIDMKASMHHPSLLIFGAPASLGPDAESLASCFVYQLQQALHTRYGTKSVLPLFAFFDEYQTLNIDIAGRLSAIVRGANGGLTVILQNISQIDSAGGHASPELKTIFSNASIRVCLHNADETTAKFFSEEIGKHAVVVPGIADHYMANGFGIFPTSWNRIHSQQVVARVDSDSIKRMEKHHALVYLAPAGDPEFGETKPLMVDLRGIEEIARLHLLHNVQGRRPAPPDGQDPLDPNGGGGGGMTPDAGSPDGGHPMGDGTPPVGELPQFPNYFPGQPSQGPPPPTFPVTVPGAVAPAASVVAPHTGGQPDQGNRLCPTCGKGPGKGKFCIECGAFVGATAAGAQPQVELATSATVLENSVATDQSATPTFPTFVQPTPAAAAPVEQVAAAPALRRASLFESPQQIAEVAGSAYGAPPTIGNDAPQQPGVVQGAKRQPVKSFNLDPSRLGYPSPTQQPANGGQGIEF